MHALAMKRMSVTHTAHPGVWTEQVPQVNAIRIMGEIAILPILLSAGAGYCA